MNCFFIGFLLRYNSIILHRLGSNACVWRIRFLVCSGLLNFALHRDLPDGRARAGTGLRRAAKGSVLIIEAAHAVGEVAKELRATGSG